MNKKGLTLASAIVDFFSIFLFAIFAVILFFLFTPTPISSETLPGAVLESSERILLLNYLRTPVEGELTFADFIGMNVKGDYSSKLKAQTEDFLDKYGYALVEGFGRANLQIVYFDSAQKIRKGALVFAGNGCKKLTASIRLPTADINTIAIVSLLRCDKE
jgi:hypothetical protein